MGGSKRNASAAVGDQGNMKRNEGTVATEQRTGKRSYAKAWNGQNSPEEKPSVQGKKHNAELH